MIENIINNILGGAIPVVGFMGLLFLLSRILKSSKLLAAILGFFILCIALYLMKNLDKLPEIGGGIIDTIATLAKEAKEPK